MVGSNEVNIFVGGNYLRWRTHERLYTLGASATQSRESILAQILQRVLSNIHLPSCSVALVSCWCPQRLKKTIILWQIPVLSKNNNSLVMPSALRSCIFVQAETILMESLSTTSTRHSTATALPGWDFFGGPLYLTTSFMISRDEMNENWLFLLFVYVFHQLRMTQFHASPRWITIPEKSIEFFPKLLTNKYNCRINFKSPFNDSVVIYELFSVSLRFANIKLFIFYTRRVESLRDSDIPSIKALIMLISCFNILLCPTISFNAIILLFLPCFTK